MRGAVSGRVAAATPVRLACASRSLGRLALVAPTCLPAAASVSIYTILSRYTLTMLRALTLRRRPAVTLSPRSASSIAAEAVIACVTGGEKRGDSSWSRGVSARAAVEAVA